MSLLATAARPRRAHLPSLAAPHHQLRHASLIRRPKRPYTFTQLITLSDGSTFLHRTTSPQPLYRSTKDTKNSALWNPSSQKLLNIEEDEAGRLKRFRRRFGRGFDAEAMEEGEEVSYLSLASYNTMRPRRLRRCRRAKDDADLVGWQAREGEESLPKEQQDESLLDLIAGYGQQAEKKGEAPAGVREGKQSSGKGSGGQK